MSNIPRHRVLLADADETYRQRLAGALAAQGIDVSQAASEETAASLLSHDAFQLLICDLGLPLGGGLDLMVMVHERFPETALMLTIPPGHGERLLTSLGEGFCDLREKPAAPEVLLPAALRALERATLRQAFHYLRHEQPYVYNLDAITAQSPAMHALLEEVRALAREDRHLIILGETGSGRAFLAGALHANSARRDSTLAKVNCASLSGPLLAVELFGEESPAGSRVGRLAQALGGGVILEEAQTLSPLLAQRLAQALADGWFTPEGGQRRTRLDIRLLATATPQNGREGPLADLAAGLKAVRLEIPPLRARREDILPLAELFLKSFCAEMDRPVPQMEDDLRELLLAHSWPGNVRELKNLMERLALFRAQPAIGAAEAAPLLGGQARLTGEDPETASGLEPLNLKGLERQAIIAALEAHDWVQKKAASALGVTERTMTYKLNKLGIRHPRFRARHRRGPEDVG